MASNYIVSAQKPTAITHAVVGNFTAPGDLNLVLAKTNRIELLSITPAGLKPFREVPIFGRIAAVKAFRPPSEVNFYMFLAQMCHKGSGDCYVRILKI